MPLAFAPDTAALLASGRTAERDMVLFDFPSGRWGFWSDAADIDVPIGAQLVRFVGAGSLLDLGDMRKTRDLAAQKVTLTLRSIPGTALTPDILATIEQEQYHQRPATLLTAYLDPDTGALVSVEVEMRGLVDRIVHREDTVAALDCFIETRTRDITKSGFRRRSDLDQRRIDPTDEGLKHTATVHTEVDYFGRLTPAEQAWKDGILAHKAKKSKGWFG